MKFVYIYTLEDPISRETRYVGKTNNIKQRFKAHNNSARYKDTHKFNWIKKLKDSDLKPILKIIDEVPENEWKYWEKFWIEQFKQWGFNLVNSTSGGDGLTNGNQTSWKKGNKPWNTGKGNIKKCIICNTEFKSPKSANRKTCSKECSSKVRQQATKKTQFKKSVEPWNKNKKGHKTKKRIPVLQYTLDNKFIKEFECCEDAAKEVKCGTENIRNACVGRSKTAKGFIWKYINY